AEGLARADAEQHFVGEGIALLEVMRIVRTDEAQPDLLAEARHQRNDLLLIGNAMVLDLEKEIVRPEDLAELQRRLFRLLIVAGGERLRHLAFQTRRKNDQPLA